MDAKDGGSIIQTGVAFNELTSLQNQYLCQNVIFTVPIINTRLNGFDIHVSKYVVHYTIERTGHGTGTHENIQNTKSISNLIVTMVNNYIGNTLNKCSA